VFEQRSHLGGNCYDYRSSGTFIHAYGSHIYHNPNTELHEWLSQFTTWEPYRHSVTAEVSGGKQVPFPYSKETEGALGEQLTDQGIIDTFFRGYSEKMWGKPWEQIPDSIRNRVPKRQEKSDFFPGQITGMPTRGYSWMLENMLDGCDVVLGAEPDAWVPYASEVDHVIYCGRMDRLRTPQGLYFGSYTCEGGVAWLDHVTLRFEWGVGEPVAPTGVLNYCHTGTPAIRRVQHAQLTGGTSRVFHMEYPSHTNSKADLTPIYPAPRTPRTPKVLEFLGSLAKQYYPNLHPLGRIASHAYLDMHQSAHSGRALGMRLL
jgi:UDP-galactopyranose mutase